MLEARNRADTRTPRIRRKSGIEHRDHLAVAPRMYKPPASKYERALPHDHGNVGFAK